MQVGLVLESGRGQQNYVGIFCFAHGAIVFRAPQKALRLPPLETRERIEARLPGFEILGAKPLSLRAENLETRETGFYSLASLQRGQPQRLLWGAKNYRTVGKAKDADVVLLTATTFQ